MVANRQGTITAEAAAPTPAGAPPGAEQKDTSLPDSSLLARVWLAVFLLLAVVVAIIWAEAGSADPFDPSANKEANFALFAGFYIAAQVIERALEVVAPLLPSILPGWKLPTGVPDGTPKAAQVKADRAAVILGLATLLGVIVSCAFGLYFLRAVGIDSVARWIDVVATGLTISGGTKTLHGFIGLLQKQTAPATGTGTSGV